jgi:hypothetical protein
MRRFLVLFFAGLSVAVACNKQPVVADVAESNEIVLNVGDSFSASVDTRATAVTAVPNNLYWGATTGSGNNERQKWNAVSASVTSQGSNRVIATGQYQTANPTTYNYYVSNQSFSIPSQGAVSMTVGNNGTDVIVGRASSSASNPSVVLGHIFSRTGALNLNVENGYTATDVSWSIVGRSSNGINGTAGTYNMTSGQWTAASTRLTSDTPVSSGSDLYLIPGDYVIKVSGTLTKGDYSGPFSKQADIALQQGKVNNITGTIRDNPATDIVITVTLTDWGSNDIDVQF